MGEFEKTLKDGGKPTSNAEWVHLIPVNMWPPIKINPDILKIVDKTLLKKFREKYNIENVV